MTRFEKPAREHLLEPHHACQTVISGDSVNGGAGNNVLILDDSNDGDFEDLGEVAGTDQARATVPSTYLADNPSRVVLVLRR